MSFSTRRATPLAAAFFGFWAGLTFTATHWPRLKIVAPIERPDLVAHMVAFGTWTFAATMCAFFGPRFSVRNVLCSALMAAVYASINEGSQFPAFLGRTVGWDDWAFNQAGVWTAAAACLMIALWKRSSADSSLGAQRADVTGDACSPTLQQNQ